MWEVVGIGFSLLTTVTGFAVIWGKTMAKVERLDRDISTLRKGLWRGNGTSVM